MKKLIFCIMAAFMLLSILPTQVNAATETNKVSVVAAKTVESEDAIATAQLARLEEINTMDRSTLTRSEKKELRNEVRTIRSDQDGRGRRGHDGRSGGNYNGRHHGGTVFIMGGGGLLILLLLILLL